jgi:hypothetical protein
MAQSLVALLCVGSLVAWDDAVVIPCDHPASPFAPSAPAIVVPRIQTLGVESVTPDLAEKGDSSAHHRQTTSGQSAGPAKGGTGHHQHRPVPASDGAQRQH